jgi:hemerythrin-like domain-containing protein
MDANLDPLVVLRAEHEEIRDVLSKFDGYLKQINTASTEESKDTPISRISEIAEFMDKDLELHFKKEEQALFPILGNYIGIETGPINVMIIEHNHCRDISADFKAKINSYPSDKNSKMLIAAGNSLSRLISEHEDKEDNILFNMAEMHLTKDEKHEITEKMNSVI